MALTKGVNSYATVAEANTYFSDRVDVPEWATTDDATKAQLLITAARVLDDMPWTGMAIDEAQQLAFPRVGDYFDPRLGTGIILDGTTVPDRVINANIELAYHLLINSGLLNDTGGALDISIAGGVSLSQITTPNQISPFIRKMINPLLVNSGSRMWWRAN